MPDRGWKAFERRLCRDVGSERVPVTGERAGADGISGPFAFQFQLRRALPAWLFAWLAGIVATAERAGKIGLLMLKLPRMQDGEALVVHALARLVRPTWAGGIRRAAASVEG